MSHFAKYLNYKEKHGHWLQGSCKLEEAELENQREGVK